MWPLSALLVERTLSQLQMSGPGQVTSSERVERGVGFPEKAWAQLSETDHMGWWQVASRETTGSGLGGTSVEVPVCEGLREADASYCR